MKHMLAVGVVAVAMGLPGTQLAGAQDTKTVRGTVRATAPAAVTVDIGGTDMTFNVDAATVVTVRDGSIVMQRSRAEGKTGVPYTDLVKVGQTVEVAYHETGMHAARIWVVPGSTKQSRAPTASPPSPTVGVVIDVSDTLLTIRSSRGEQTYAVDGRTKVSGRGLGAQARTMKRAGEKPVLSRFVHRGDTVQVRSEEEANGNRHASEVRVTRKS